MIVTLSRSSASVVVAFGEYAWRVAMNRFGKHDAVLRWPEFQAVAAGVEKASSPAQAEERLREALGYFRTRQALPPA
jgi:hypothetical protein